ncbi:hypothetical protein [Nocardioides sp. LHG3406-4]|uniref:hypothetical protein n=1 Tax=Nocardioides sp. LHG3406-4 TaxID=2804575 RepID=UPI003CF81FF9
MASEEVETEEAGDLGWRGLVVVAATLLTVAAMALAIRASFSRDEPDPTGLPDIVPIASQAAVVKAAPRLEVEVVPLASGDVNVTEVLRTSKPLLALELRLPPSTSSRPLGTAPRVLDLELDAGDVRMSVPPAGAAGPWEVRLPEPSVVVTLTYRLVGATTHSAAAAKRRVLVHVRPLASAAGPPDASVVMEIRDVSVHNIVCPDLPVEEQLCGREDGGLWRTTTIPAAQSTVVTQIDLPRG